MNCMKCNAELNDDARFCDACGASQKPGTARCRKCDAEIKPGAKFCSVCGARQSAGTKGEALMLISFLCYIFLGGSMFVLSQVSGLDPMFWLVSFFAIVAFGVMFGVNVCNKL